MGMQAIKRIVEIRGESEDVCASAALGNQS